MKLTKRQTEIIKLVAQGCGDKEIAGKLALSCRTISVHVAGAIKRLKARSRSHAVAIFVRKM